MTKAEALSLWLEDFDISGCTITIHDRGETENLSEIKTVSSPRKLDCSQDLLEVFTEYVCFFHTEGIKTNHVFVKLMGRNAGRAMDYIDVDNLFRKLRKRTGIYITPHMFRHTSLSLLNSAGWEPELLRIRAAIEISIQRSILMSIRLMTKCLRPLERHLGISRCRERRQQNNGDFGTGI